jgi:uncharacterized protein YndB with AHSA1/START domain
MSNGETLGGNVVVWEPPRRFVVEWRTGASDRPATEVEVRFTASGETTLVELEHRGWERMRDVAAVVRPDYASGWRGALARFAEAAEREAA